MKGKFSLILIIIAFIAGFFISNLTGKYKIVEKEKLEQHTNFKEQHSSSIIKNEKNDEQNNQYNDNNIPIKVYDIIKHIKKYNKAPDGYVGGRQFMKNYYLKKMRTAIKFHTKNGMSIQKLLAKIEVKKD